MGGLNGKNYIDVCCSDTERHLSRMVDLEEQRQQRVELEDQRQQRVDLDGGDRSHELLRLQQNTNQLRQMHQVIA